MVVNWYVSKNTWMTGNIHHQIMNKFNNQMRRASCHVLCVCDQATKSDSTHTLSSLCCPQCYIYYAATGPRCHSFNEKAVQEQIGREVPCVCGDNKDANVLLKSSDIVAATNMIAIHGGKLLLQLSRIAFAKQASNTF